MQNTKSIKSAVTTFVTVFVAFMVGTLVKMLVTGTGFDPNWVLCLSSASLCAIFAYLNPPYLSDKTA